jgi:hypothetical protein
VGVRFDDSPHLGVAVALQHISVSTLSSIEDEYFLFSQSRLKDTAMIIEQSGRDDINEIL